MLRFDEAQQLSGQPSDTLGSMFDATYQTPEVPTELGEDHAVYFTKSGNEYRILMAAPSIWLIHQAGTTREQFEVTLEHPDATRRVFDATARGRVNFTALGYSLSEILHQAC